MSVEDCFNDDVMFSIVVPAYNAEKYVGEAIGSVCAQRYSNWEIIVVDDGSTDRTRSVVENYVNADDRIHLVCQDNAGPFAARALAYQFVKGDYVLHLDADDAYHPEAFSRLNSVLKQRKWDIVFFEYSRNLNSWPMEARFPFQRSRSFEQNEMVQLLNLITSSTCLNTMWSKAIKAKLVVNTSYPPNLLHLISGEDRVQSLYIIDRAMDALYLREPLYFYRINNGGTTLSFREAGLEDAVLSRRNMRTFVEKWQKRPGFSVSLDDVGKDLMGSAFNYLKQAARYQGYEGACRSSIRVSQTPDIASAWSSQQIRSVLRADERMLFSMVFSGHHHLAAWFAYFLYGWRR